MRAGERWRRSIDWLGAGRSPVCAGALSGALLTLATSPLGLGWLAFPALAPLFRASIEARTPRSAASAGLSCGLVFFGAGYLWVPWNLGGSAWPVWGIGVPVLALPLAGLAAAITGVARGFGPLPALCLAPAAFAALEVLHASGPFGIGWLRLGHALAAWPTWIQLARLGGVPLVSAWAAAVGAALAYALSRRSPRAALAAAAILALGTLYGVGSLATAPVRAAPAFRIAAVQPDVAAAERFAPERFDANLDRLLELSERALAGALPDLIAWPESAFEQPSGPSGVPFLGAIASSLDTPVLAGVRRLAADPTWRWNSAVLAEQSGDTRVLADKQRPLPLYERAPAFRLPGALARAVGLPGRVLAGAPAEPSLVVARDGSTRRLGVLVCIDAVFPEIARRLRHRGADLLVSIANEAEAGIWSARQHALLVRFRAVETGVPLVRVANGGPSVWIDPVGREIARLDPGAAAAAVALGPSLDAPPYTALGDAPVLVALFLPGLLYAAASARDIRARTRRLAQRALS